MKGEWREHQAVSASDRRVHLDAESGARLFRQSVLVFVHSICRSELVAVGILKLVPDDDVSA